MSNVREAAAELSDPCGSVPGLADFHEELRRRNLPILFFSACIFKGIEKIIWSRVFAMPAAHELPVNVPEHLFSQKVHKNQKEGCRFGIGIDHIGRVFHKLRV